MAARVLVFMFGAAALVAAAVLASALLAGVPAATDAVLGRPSPEDIYSSYAVAAAGYGLMAIAVAAGMGRRSIAAYVCVVLLQGSAVAWCLLVEAVGSGNTLIVAIAAAGTLGLIGTRSARSYYLG